MSLLNNDFAMLLVDAVLPSGMAKLSILLLMLKYLKNEMNVNEDVL